MSWQIVADMREMFVEAFASNGERCFCSRNVNRKDHLLSGFIEMLQSWPEEIKSPSTEVLIKSDFERTAIREQWGVATAFLCTEGFENLMEIADQTRVEAFGFHAHKGSNLVPHEWSIGVTERTRADGTVESELDDKEIDFVISKLELAQIKSVAVCFLHSRANPAHEEQVAKKLRDKGYFVEVSHKYPGNERQRAQRAIQKAFMGPLFEAFQEDIVKLGFERQKIKIWEDGDLSSKKDEVKVTFLEDRILTSLGSALSLSGLSRISIDSGGLAHVGPDSEESEPGPVCFGKNLHLTLLDMVALACRLSSLEINRLRIDLSRVVKFLAPLAKDLKQTPETAAKNFIDLAATNMALELALLAEKKGLTPTSAHWSYDGWMAPLFGPLISKKLGTNRYTVASLHEWRPLLCKLPQIPQAGMTVKGSLIFEGDMH